MRHALAHTRHTMLATIRRTASILVGALALILWTPESSTSAQGQPAPSPAQAASIPASRQATNVAVITIHGAIDDTTFKSVRRRIDAAERAGADALVFEIDTPGGEVNAALKICAEIKSTSIRNTIAWVNRDALSAGAIIALACREVVTNEPSKLGDALPVIGAPGVGIIGSINQLPEHERQKLLTPLVAELVESARMFGRDEFLVQGIVSRGVELWWIENKQTGRRVAINADEFELIFGQRPTRGSPTLTAAPPGAEAAAPGGPAVQPSAGARAAERRARRVRPPEAGPATGIVEDANPFVPASPALTELSAAMRDRPVPVGSTRPTFSAADQGQWTLLEYISTGDGPFLFNAPQLIHFELATDVVRSDEELKAFLGAKHLVRLNQSWSEGLVAFLTLLPVRGVLLVLFLLGLFIEMTHPGTVLPGTVALGALVGLLAPPLLIDLANWWQAAAILLGIVLIAIELFVIPGFGIPGIMGALLLLGGLVGAFLPVGITFPDTPVRERGVTYGAATLLLSLTTAGVLMYVVARHLGSLPVLNRLVLRDQPPDEDAADDLLPAMGDAAVAISVGSIGRALTPLRPAGRVDVGGRVVDAASDVGFIEAGAAVRVSSLSEFRVGVEPIS